MKSILNMVKKLLTFPKANNHGYALPMVLLMIALLMGTTTYLVTRNIKELEANQKSHDYEVGILTAKNGMEEIKALISRGDPVIKGTSEDPNGGHYSYELFKKHENIYEGTLESSYRHYQKEFRLEVELDSEQGKPVKIFFWEKE